MAPVVHALRAYPDVFDVCLCSTGQHTTMLKDALSVFNIEADVELDVMRPGQSLAQLTCRLLSGLDSYFASACPDIVLVHGDTTSAMVGAMAAFYRGITVGHVEAGLRTGNLCSPFPEEYNRKCVALSAEYHFAPTMAACANLKSEGVVPERVYKTGNTVIDALLFTITRLESSSSEQERLNHHFSSMIKFDLQNTPYVLITAHRRENFGDGIRNICFSIDALARANPNIRFIYPVHLNPQVRDVVEDKLAGIDNVSLIPPQDYMCFAWLLRHCLFIMTDSGGIQEEAPALGKPVLVLRDTSERPEAIEAGTARLVTTDPGRIIHEAQRLIDDNAAYASMVQAINPFGDGHAAKYIAEHLKNMGNASE